MLIQTAAKWAQAEFGQVKLGDARRTARVVKCATALAETPGGTLPEPLAEWAELKAAYRLLSNPEVSFERLQQPHWERTWQACCNRGEYLLIEDTTQLDFTSHEAVTGLGRIGDDGGRGFFAHTTLAVRVERWTAEQEPVLNVQGLLWQQVWTRDDETRTGRVTKGQRLSGPRESDRWASVFGQCGDAPPGAKWTYIADREGDIAEVFHRMSLQNLDFIVRTNQARAVVSEEGNIFELAARAPVKGTVSVSLRARPGQPARTAELQIRARRVTIRGPWRPGGNLPPFELNVVELKEHNPPPKVEPLHWILSTSWPCESLAQCRAIAQAYSARWLIEEYHKALKTGTGIEKSQLSTVQGLQALLGVLALVAVRLLNLKMLARSAPDRTLEPGALGSEALAVLTAKYGMPKSGWNNRSALVAIARLGGFLARKGDGDPGWLTIWRGWRRLVLLCEGYTLGVESCG